MSKYEQAIKLLEMLSSDEFQQFTSSEFDDAIYVAIEALEKQMPKWDKTSEVKPTEEKQYLCCSMYTDKPFFKVLYWSNNLYEVDKIEFYNCKGRSRFYDYDPECGYYESDCDYWQEIDWEEEDET